jgi:NAD(P)H-hydrate epimerase
MDLSKIYSKRPDWAHKGNFGSVLVIAGSKLYTGSAALAGIASLRAGADLVTIASPQRSADIAAQTLPDLITYPLKGDFLTAKHVDDIMDLSGVRKINSVVLGCGLGRHLTTMSAVRKLISKFSVPLVLDADALVAVSVGPEILRGKHFIMTPHIAELAALLNLEKINEDFESRMSNAKEAARRYGGVVLLKGHVDIITDGTSTITNNTGTPFMTKGGFGDVLAGIVGALLARGVGLFEAAHVGAYINGRAGEHMDFIGESVVASDIFGYLHKVINKRD